jgi:hypothetical protein
MPPAAAAARRAGGSAGGAGRAAGRWKGTARLRSKPEIQAGAQLPGQAADERSPVEAFARPKRPAAQVLDRPQAAALHLLRQTREDDHTAFLAFPGGWGDARVVQVEAGGVVEELLVPRLPRHPPVLLRKGRRQERRQRFVDPAARIGRVQGCQSFRKVSLADRPADRQPARRHAISQRQTKAARLRRHRDECPIRGFRDEDPWNGRGPNRSRRESPGPRRAQRRPSEIGRGSHDGRGTTRCRTARPESPDADDRLRAARGITPRNSNSALLLAPATV